MKYLSLFTGIGGFELGIQQAYEKTLGTINRIKDGRGEEYETNDDEERDRLESEEGKNISSKEGLDREYGDGRTDEGEPTCIGYSEIDKYAIQIYQKYFPNHKNYGDITKINTKEIPDFELLVGGFPCQSFSIAGKRKGFEDTRGTLFFEIARILKDKKPCTLLLENVKGLLSHDNGNTFKTIISTLDELGYDIQWQVLNSKNFGVPQNRERVFIVGHLRGTPRPEVFPFTDDRRQIDELPGHIANTITRRYEGAQATGTYIGEGKFNAQKNNTGRQDIQQERNQPNNSNGRRGQTYSTNIRRLTPLECERLQGFPDNWTEGVSDTQRYKVCGNAVSVPVIKEIIKRLL